jgi:hypothetical protein
VGHGALRGGVKRCLGCGTHSQHVELPSVGGRLNRTSAWCSMILAMQVRNVERRDTVVGGDKHLPDEVRTEHALS